MKKYKAIPNLKQGKITFTEYGLTSENIDSLNILGGGIRLTKNILDSIDLYLCPINDRDGKIGYINCYGEIIVKPIYDKVILEFKDENSVVIVGLNNKWGLINSSGKIIVPVVHDYRLSILSHTNYFPFQKKNEGWKIFDPAGNQILGLEKDYKNVESVNSEDLIIAVYNGKKGMLDLKGNIVVPFNFIWIDYDFFGGLARVIIDEGDGQKWGIINNKGKYSVSPIYDKIWKFSANHKLTNAVKEKEIIKLDLAKLRAESKDKSNYNIDYYQAQEDDLRQSTFKEFRGTYAQDVMGYDDETINDAFEGDPEAYWNID